MPTRSQVIEQGLRDISDAAADYDVDEAAVQQLRDGLPDRYYAAGYRQGRLTGLLVQTANDHRADCTASPCRTCAGLRESLTVALATTRLLADAELADRPDRPGWHWRRVLRWLWQGHL